MGSGPTVREMLIGSLAVTPKPADTEERSAIADEHPLTTAIAEARRFKPTTSEQPAHDEAKSQ